MRITMNVDVGKKICWGQMFKRLNLDPNDLDLEILDFQFYIISALNGNTYHNFV